MRSYPTESMRRGLLLGWLLLGSLFVAGCGAGVSGNQLGGVMPWSGQEPSDAFKAADAHCRSFGKSARITQIAQATDKVKGAVIFNCE